MRRVWMAVAGTVLLLGGCTSAPDTPWTGGESQEVDDEPDEAFELPAAYSIGEPPRFVAVPQSEDLYSHPMFEPYNHGGDGFWLMEADVETDDWLRVRYDGQFADCDAEFLGLEGLAADFYVRPQAVAEPSDDAVACIEEAEPADWFDLQPHRPEDIDIEPPAVAAPTQFNWRDDGLSGVIRDVRRLGPPQKPDRHGRLCFAPSDAIEEQPNTLDICFSESVVENHLHFEVDSELRREADDQWERRLNWQENLDAVLEDRRDDFLDCLPPEHRGGRFASHYVRLGDASGTPQEVIPTLSATRRDSEDDEYLECLRRAANSITFPRAEPPEVFWIAIDTGDTDEVYSRLARLPETPTYGALQASHPRDVLRSYRHLLDGCIEPGDVRLPADVDGIGLRAVLGPSGELVSASVMNPPAHLSDDAASCLAATLHGLQMVSPEGGGVVRVQVIYHPPTQRMSD